MYMYFADFFTIIYFFRNLFFRKKKFKHLSIKPLLINPFWYFQFSVGLSRVYVNANRVGCSLAKSSISSRSKISFSVWFAKSSQSRVSSSDLKTSRTICNMGVIPDPPAIKPMFLIPKNRKKFVYNFFNYVFFLSVIILRGKTQSCHTKKWNIGQKSKI